MNRLFSICVLAALAAGCTTPQANFAAMSESELLAYNRDRPIMEQIYCEEGRQRTGSHIRRTECKTVEEWVTHNFRTQQTIQTMSVGRPFN